eukprot:scaffold191249_cov30-Tisochrysis_lutea.AAC.8
MPRYDWAFVANWAKHEVTQVFGALCSRLLERETAFAGVGLMYEKDRLIPLHGCARLSQAVARREIASRKKHEHHHCFINIGFECADVLKVVHVQEDLHAMNHPQ